MNAAIEAGMVKKKKKQNKMKEGKKVRSKAVFQVDERRYGYWMSVG